ncbi:chaperonin 10-like protein [Staphylotrichum tortipilum]|uniref:Chaperonin 10-like protein n=1 Tax=Staphylotrichum tortipilum TaxID=2831512 RepID=A0AAN6RRR6_9PEZI|nr:chaperonin 10-like protein [Staphylotrichum longicolle]
MTSFFRRLPLKPGRKAVPASGTDETQTLPQADEQVEPLPIPTPKTQTVLLLLAANQQYQLTEKYEVPQLQGEQEVLVRTQAIGLNPIDWKAPDFNFAIPTLPYISGRELAGEVVQKSSLTNTRLKTNDRVLAISTDYRDLRKAAYQEYVVAFDYNTVRLPPSISAEQGSTLGVAFVAAALALGVCMGVDFSSVLDGPDLFTLLRQLDPEVLPSDVRQECLDGILSHERATPGDWLAVWGGSSTSANLTIQLAKLVGLKTIAIVDTAKHGLRLANHKAIRTDLLVDSHDPKRAVNIIRANLDDKLRFGIDTRGRESASSLLQALSPGSLPSSRVAAATTQGSPPPSPPATPHNPTQQLSAHLIGLTGLPKESPPEGAMFHTVPIKLFHEVPAIGSALVLWLERLLEKGLISPPEIIDVERGLESVNKGLDRMRKGEISGGKLVVQVR